MQRQKRAGFTLVEIMIVVVIIGLLASMAIPTFISLRRSSTHTRFMNDVRVFKDAVGTYALEHGVLPIDSNSGALDPAMAEYIRDGFFARPTPLGGVWDIEADDTITLGVGVDGYSVSKEELALIDERFDDGDLQTGRLIEIMSGQRYYWVIEP